MKFYPIYYLFLFVCFANTFSSERVAKITIQIQLISLPVMHPLLCHMILKHIILHYLQPNVWPLPFIDSGTNCLSTRIIYF